MGARKSGSATRPVTAADSKAGAALRDSVWPHVFLFLPGMTRLFF